MSIQQTDYKSLTEFDIVGELGLGGFGYVYRVIHKTSLRELALKEANLSIIMKRLEKEGLEIAKKAADQTKDEYLKMEQLKHPNIVTVYGSFEEIYQGNDPKKKGDLMYYLVMEFCEGGDLETAIKEASKRNERFPEDRILLWSRQLVSALSYIHDLEFVHRDIKPKNMLLTAGHTVIKLGDFGIAKAAEMVRDSSRFCTAQFSSPEFLDGQRYTQKCDVWSLGVSLLNVAILNLPNPKTLRNQNVAIPNDYSVELRDFILKMLEQDTKKRPSSRELLSLWSVIREATKERPNSSTSNLSRSQSTFFIRSGVFSRSSKSLNLDLVRSSSDIPEILKETTCQILSQKRVSAVSVRNSYDEDEIRLLFVREDLKDAIIKWQQAGLEEWKDTQLMELGKKVFQIIQKGSLEAFKNFINTEQVPLQGRKCLLQQKDDDGNQALSIAALLGKLDFVKFLVQEMNCEVDILGSEGNTPLLQAAGKGNLEVVKFLIENKADPKARETKRGALPIHLAAIAGNVETVMYLLLIAPECLEARDSRLGRTPLLWAVCSGKFEVVKFLIEHKADLTARDSCEGALAIHLASQFCDVETIKFLMPLMPNWLEAKTSNFGRTPLMKAAEVGNLEVIKFLVKNKVDLRTRDKQDGALVIHLASAYGNVETVRYLLSLKPDWREVRTILLGRTPLLNAAAGGNLEVLKFLIQQKSDIDARDTESCALAIHLASKTGNVETVQYLLSLKPEWLEAKTTSFGRTPLIKAAEGGNLEVVKFLVENKADVDASDYPEGAFAIHLASQSGTVETVEFLLSSKPNYWLNVKTIKRGRTPLMIAAGVGNLAVAKFLLQNKADLDARDGSDGALAIHMASQFGNVAIVEYLLALRPDWLEARDSRYERTPLLKAAEGGNLDVLKFFLNDKNADIEAVDKEGHSSLHLASNFGHIGTVKFLIEVRAQLGNFKDNSGKRPLDYAERENRIEVVEILKSVTDN